MLALPAEAPGDVLDLAATFGARWVVLTDPETPWPANEALRTDEAFACFEPVALPSPADPADAALLAELRVFRIGCDATP